MGDGADNDGFFSWFELTLISGVNIDLAVSEPLPGQWSFLALLEQRHFKNFHGELCNLITTVPI